MKRMINVGIAAALVLSAALIVAAASGPVVVAPVKPACAGSAGANILECYSLGCASCTSASDKKACDAWCVASYQ